MKSIEVTPDGIIHYKYIRKDGATVISNDAAPWNGHIVERIIDFDHILWLNDDCTHWAIALEHQVLEKIKI